MSKISKFIKSSGIYFVGNVLTKVISFFLLPLYTNYIPPDGMGYFDLSNSYLNIIVPVVAVTIWSGVLRYIFDFDNEKEKYKVIFNGMIVFLSGTLLFSIGSLVLGSVTDIKSLLLIYILGVAMILQNFYSYTARGLGYNTIFAVSGIVGGLVNCLSNIVMIYCFNMKEESLFIALSLGLFIQIIIMETKVKLLAHFSIKLFDKEMLIAMIKYSAPVALNSACYWFLSSYNKIGVSNILGLEANGIYSIAGKYTYVIGLLSNCFSMAMQEMLYSMGNTKEGKSEFYTKVSNYYIKFLNIGLVLLMPIVVVSFPILIGKGYSAAFELVPLYLFATVGSIFAGFLGDIFAAEKKTNSLFYTTIVAAVVNIAVFHLLVNQVGIQAANISLSLGYIVMIIVRLLLLKKDFSIKINIKMMLATFSLFIIACIVYFKLGIIANIVAFIIFAVIALVVFRDLLKQLFGIFFSKVKK